MSPLSYSRKRSLRVCSEVCCTLNVFRFGSPITTRVCVYTVCQGRTFRCSIVSLISVLLRYLMTVHSVSCTLYYTTFNHLCEIKLLACSVSEDVWNIVLFYGPFGPCFCQQICSFSVNSCIWIIL